MIKKMTILSLMFVLGFGLLIPSMSFARGRKSRGHRSHHKVVHKKHRKVVHRHRHRYVSRHYRGHSHRSHHSHHRRHHRGHYHGHHYYSDYDSCGHSHHRGGSLLSGLIHIDL